MKTRLVIYAEQGKVLTNGTIYGKQIFLADNDTPDAYYEITQAEYDEILHEEDGVVE